jgi:hypothetical protein
MRLLDKEKNNKITTSFPIPSINIAAFVLLVVILLFFSLAGYAKAENTPPRWVIKSTSDPTNINPPSPSTEVLDITIHATGGTFTLDASGDEGTTKPIAYDATPEEVHNALEGPFAEGPANRVGEHTTVTGSRGAYVVTYPTDSYLSGLTGYATRMEPITADGSGLKLSGECVAGTPNSCPGGTATVSVVSQGAAHPTLTLTAINVGGSAADDGAGGSPIIIGDTLPAGFTATGISAIDAYHQFTYEEQGGNLECATSPAIECTFSGLPVDPGDNLIVTISLDVAGPPVLSEGESVVNRPSVSGGGAAPAFASTPLTIGSAPAAFGIVPGSLVTALSSTRAGAHANITTAFTLNTGTFQRPAADPKDVEFDVPVGLVGDAVGLPQCTTQGVVESVVTGGESCPAGSIAGTATTAVVVKTSGFVLTEGETEPVYNIAPAPGEPAAFEFTVEGYAVRLDASVLSAGDYGVRVTAPNIDENGGAVSSAVTIWGVPSEHNGPGPDRFLFYSGEGAFGGPGTGPRTAFLSNPTQCSQPLSGTLLTDPWPAPGAFV